MTNKSEISNATEDLNIIQFSDIFNLDDIQRLQDLFAETNEVASIITHPDGTPITKPSNFCRLCNDIIRKTEKGHVNCFKSNAIIGRYQPSDPILQKCRSCGLREAGASITIGNQHIANWFIGQVRNKQFDESEIINYAKEIGANPKDFIEALNEVPEMSPEQFDKKLKLLFVFAHELSEKAYNNFKLKQQIAESEKANLLLKNREKQLHTIIETAMDGFWLTDMQGNIIDVNESYCQMSGYTKQELLKMNISDIEEKAFESNTRLHFKKILKQGDDRFESCHRSKDGSLFDVEVRVQYHSVNNGQFVCYFHDITKRKQTNFKLKENEASLSRQNELMSVLLKNLQMGVFMAEVPSGKPLVANEAALKLLGRGILPDVTRHNLGQVYKAYKLNSREPYPIDDMPITKAMKGISSHVNDMLIERPDGTESLLEVYGSPVADKDGKIWASLVCFFDITDRKKAEEALFQEQHLMESLMNNIPEQIYFKDLESRFVRINKYQAKYLGLNDTNEAIGKTDFDFFSIEHAQQAFDDEQEIIRTGNSIFKEEKETYPNKPDRWVLTSKLPLHDKEQKVIGTFGISMDITKRKEYELQLIETHNIIKAKKNEYQSLSEQYKVLNEELIKSNDKLQKTITDLEIAKEKAEESDRLKSAFLQNMSHELRTPMNAIMGFSQLLVKNYNNKPKLEKFSEIINQLSKDLLHIINDILDIAKIESGQLAVNIEDCNLIELFAELSSFFTEHQKRIGKQHILFSLEPLNEVSENMIMTDVIKLKQIFINLIGNAFKFTDSGSIRVNCELDDSKTKIIFNITDTGIGIPKDMQEKVFERFSQIDHGPNRIVGGTGLGLSIVKGLINLLDGSIWLESESGKGCTFSFSIPYKIAQSENIKSVEPESSNVFQFQNKTILVVEDDLYNSEYIKEILSTTGANIVHAMNGKDAIEITLSQSPDIILMDIRLPDMNGFEATQQIKQIRPQINIIAQTAYASDNDKQLAFKVGCIDYISKPLNPSLLLSLIKKYISKSKN